MIIDKINLNHLRLFECVYRTHSMTEAAKELHLTQSGISQHIKSLEENLETKLFDRIKQKLIPTPKAILLYPKCKDSLYNIEKTLQTFKSIPQGLSGTVRIGMPIEFGNNCVMPLLSQFCKNHSLLNLDIRYGYAYEMNQLILNGELDFAFVDSFGFDKRVTCEKVYDEVLIFCASKDYLKKKGHVKEEKNYFESLEYIEYLKGAPVLNMWFQYHFPKKHFQFDTRATVMDVQGVAKMILNGVGAGILPSHHILKLSDKAKQLHHFKGSGKLFKNEISLAYLREKTHSPTTLTLLQWIKTHLLDLQSSSQPLYS